jgi:uncharacterized protein (DUF486 family)
MPQQLITVTLLFFSNIFMTYAWYGHLKDHKNSALIWAVLVSWGVAFFEYCLQVPANRIGAQVYTLPQLKIIQEVLTLVVFGGFSVLYLNLPFKMDYVWAAGCLVGAVYFVFR